MRLNCREDVQRMRLHEELFLWNGFVIVFEQIFSSQSRFHKGWTKGRDQIYSSQKGKYREADGRVKCWN